MSENRIARYLNTGSHGAAAAVTTQSQPSPAPRPATSNWNVMSQADVYRLAFERAREEAERKRWSNNRIRRYFE